MAVAGDTNHVPSFLVTLERGYKIKIHAWSTNKPRQLVEMDLERAYFRLLVGHTFQLHCSGTQVILLNHRLESLRKLPKWTETWIRLLYRFEWWHWGYAIKSRKRKDTR